MSKTCVAYIFNKPQRHREHGEEKERGEKRREEKKLIRFFTSR
jgi:hypothetical protein